jgi:hypothetical protein
MSLVGGMLPVGGAGRESSGWILCLATRFARSSARARFQPSLTARGSIQTTLIASNIMPVITPPTAPIATMKTAPSRVPPHQRNCSN